MSRSGLLGLLTALTLWMIHPRILSSWMWAAAQKLRASNIVLRPAYIRYPTLPCCTSKQLLPCRAELANCLIFYGPMFKVMSQKKPSMLAFIICLSAGSPCVTIGCSDECIEGGQDENPGGGCIHQNTQEGEAEVNGTPRKTTPVDNNCTRSRSQFRVGSCRQSFVDQHKCSKFDSPQLGKH